MLLANQELAIRRNDESATSFNRGNYVGLICAFAENDERISRHLETSTVFLVCPIEYRTI